ncbi:MAG TPA: hypothetical protein VEV38_10735 [Candidatus Eremiobacteraceae bacterium]|nr:hypothetical protein [Candidatus Eremiobacteraceae bacterium]
MRSPRAFALAIVTFALFFAPSLASADTHPYDAMRWRMIGPFRGGRSIAVTGVPGNATLFYFGAVAGGVWKSGDAGRTWKPIFDSQPIASIGAIAVAASDPSTIYVGSGEADMRSDITYGDGMYKSTDGGATWHHIGLDDTRQIGKVAVDPQNPDRVFVAALGHGWGPNTQRGVFRSLDGGRSWQRVLYKDQNTGAIDAVIDPNDPKTVYAALWQTRRPPWNIYPPSNGPGSGLYISHDGGTSWQQVAASSFPRAGLGRMGIAVAPSDSKRVYAIVDATKGGLYRSDDGGVTWTLADADRRLWQRGWYFCTLAVDPVDRDTVYVSDTSFYRSTDGGKHFTSIKGSPDGDDFHQPWVDPRDRDRIALASDQGTSISVDRGLTWSSWFNQPTGQFYHIEADDQFPFNVYGAQQDNGAAKVPTRSDAFGITSFDWQMIVAGGESGYVGASSADPDILYGDTVSREDLRSRQTQSIDPTLAFPALYRSTWTLPLAQSRSEKGVLYFGRQMIFRSADGGNSWRIISPDLTRTNPGVPRSLDAPTAADNDGTGVRRGVVQAIAPSPIRAGEIWAGTDDGKVWVTHDEGANWHDVTPKQLTPWSKVGIIEASSFDASTAYAAIDRHQVDDLRPYIYKTHDGGATWTPAVRGIPTGAYVNAVREDPSRRGLLYAGTELGVYVSFDDGANWQSLRLNMPVVPVRDLVIEQDSLAIATHGRSFWVLDDLSPLHEPLSTSSAAWLFAPETAIRMRPHVDPSEALPPEEPAGENRPDGAFVDYVVNAKLAGPLTLSIYDASGMLVRRYSSAHPPNPTNPDELDFPAFWSPTPPALEAMPGAHRFAWDFQYALLPGEPESGFLGGVLAPPGKYTVRLSEGGRTWSQPLVVEKDPRVRASDADLVEQFRVAREIESMRVLAKTSYETAIRRGKKRLAGGPPAQNPDNSLGAPTVEFTSFWAVGQGLEALQGAVESADTPPTADEMRALSHWHSVLDADRRQL